MRARILDLIVENFMLIDRMGEGLLILNEKDDSIELINKQARKLLKDSDSSAGQFEVHKTNVGTNNLRAAIFTSTTISRQEEDGRERSASSGSASLMSLLDIIE